MLCQLPGISAFLISTRPGVTLCGWQAVKIRLLTIISAILIHSASFSKPLFKHKSLLVSLQSIKGVIVRSLPLQLGTQWVKHKKECVIAINQKFTAVVGDSVSQTQEGGCHCNQPEVYETSMSDYFHHVEQLRDWFKKSFLELNVGKTKELIIIWQE